MVVAIAGGHGQIALRLTRLLSERGDEVRSLIRNPDHPGDDTFSAYLRAKGQADAELAASGLDHTIVRPGPLTNDPGTGRVALDAGRGDVTRDDVAAVLVAVLHEPGTIGRTFELSGGETPIEEAL